MAKQQDTSISAVSVGSSQAPGMADLYTPLATHLLPSELLNSYATLPPAHFYGEDIDAIVQGLKPSASSSSTSDNHVQFLPQAVEGRSLVAVVDEPSNEGLSRTLIVNPVLESDSILGESGRLYHGYKNGKYFLPNDAAEQGRLDIQHLVFRIMLSGWLGLAPMTKVPEYVLDIGTGTGLWAQEFAENNPSSFVVGTDLSAIQPIPRVSNCTFTKSDIEDEWMFRKPTATDGSSERSAEMTKISFDYVHLRMMFTCFDDQRVVMSHAYNNLKPGGWIEYQEATLRISQANPEYKGDALQRMGTRCIEGASVIGRDIDCLDLYKEWLKQVGFVDVTERRFLWPMGGWPKHPQLKLLGGYARQNMFEGVRGASYKMLRLAGMPEAEVEFLVKQIQSELMDEDNHPYYLGYIIYARKPLVGENNS
ncbi:S-adenosyl-L-methionine-dependent methyltransferase [Xylariales sp. PMI_506]|nr:S-adenosyl-L-methionine-dependent methyltransferase [Xylariales sp. PMI_506]